MTIMTDDELLHYARQLLLSDVEAEDVEGAEVSIMLSNKF